MPGAASQNLEPHSHLSGHPRPTTSSVTFLPPNGPAWVLSPPKKWHLPLYCPLQTSASPVSLIREVLLKAPLIALGFFFFFAIVGL